MFCKDMADIGEIFLVKKYVPTKMFEQGWVCCLNSALWAFWKQHGRILSSAVQGTPDRLPKAFVEIGHVTPIFWIILV